MSKEWPWDNPDLAFITVERVYLTFDHLQKIGEYVRKLEAVVDAAKMVIHDYADPHALYILSESLKEFES